jgi:hypothetical protein
MAKLYEKINYFRSIRSRSVDKYAVKGALSTIESLVNLAYDTLKMIS